MTKIAILIAGLLLASLPGQSRAEGDPEQGRQKAYTCTGCHGIPGYNNAYPNYHVPKIGGQNYPYVVLALKAYRAGERKHPTMTAQAGSLTDRDIEDIAAYFDGLHDRDGPGVPYRPGDAAAGEQKSQICQACHGADGNGIDPQYPRLAAQYGDYMVKALQDYKSGDRISAIMAGFAAGLSEQDMHDLAAYYAAKPGLVDLTIK